MSVSIVYGNIDLPEVINNYNAQTGTLSSITFIANKNQPINVNDWVNLVITSGSFQTAAGTPIAGSTLNGMARVISKEAYRDKNEKEYIRLEFNPAKSMPGLVVPIEPFLPIDGNIDSINGTITRVSNTSQGSSGNTTAPYPAQAPAFSGNTTAPYPAQAPIIPTIVIDSASMMGENYVPMYLNLFNRLNQNTIDRISFLLTLIYDITDNNGNKFGDAFAYNDVNGVRVYVNPQFRNTYKNVLGFSILNHLFIAIIGTSFIDIFTNGNATISSMPSNMRLLYDLIVQLNNDTNKILQFYRVMFNRKDELLDNFASIDNVFPIITNILMNIVNSPPAQAPAPAPGSAPQTRNNSNSTTSRLANITRDLDYLRSLGLTATSDNETMKKTLRNYKNATGSDYVFPPAAARSREELEKELQYLRSVGFTANSDNENVKKTLRNYKNVTGSDYVFPSLSREELEKELQYLFGLGLTPDSGNVTMNDRLAKWRALTGEEYVYNPSGGKYRRKRLARKSVKRKNNGKSKTRKY